ncbi:MAG: sugar ABC transporter permease [Spirochaetia bacterium]|nr:sugar ABC transporter permease [Spirochaetia bacterium]
MAIPGNNNRKDGILFSIPFLIIYIVFMLVPLFFGLYISFNKWNILSGASFNGIDNYITLFKDAKFMSSLWNTLKFVLLSTPPLLIIGFLMALAINGKSPFKGIMENAYFIPYIFSMTVIATLWAWLFQKDFGIINHYIETLGFSPIGWLTNEKVAMHSVVVATVWWTAGFNMILMSAGMKQISKEIYESASIDGVTAFRKIFNITIPLLKPTLVLCLILQVIASFNIFGQVFVMTGGGPHGATRVLVQYIYETGFTYFKMGYSAAMSYILFLIIMIISFVQYLLLGKNDE